MAQLIKLQDYISRYEQDIYRYPTQYARLKKQQWNNLQEAYYKGTLDQLFQPEENQTIYREEEPEQHSKGMLDKMKGLFSRPKKEERQPEIQETPPRRDLNVFSLRVPQNPANLDELKQNFLNQLLRFQMKWSSSTVHERSFVDQSFYLDERLRFFLQRFPDTFLVLYKPIFRLKNAPIEVDVIVLTPLEAWCITFLEAEEDSAFVGSSDRFWMRRHHRYPDKKVLNPLLSLNRMGSIVKQLFELYDVNLPVKKVILTRNGYVDYPELPFDVEVLDKRTFPDWFEKMRTVSSPIKAQQLKGAQALLDYCQTTSSRRPEWESEAQEDGSEPAAP